LNHIDGKAAMSLNQRKIALVTGANKGLGLAISRQLAQQGMRVVMGVRDIAKGQIAVNQLRQNALEIDCQQLDVTDPESIAAIRNYLTQTHGKLDILINNAGICLDAGQSPSGVSLDTIRQTFETCTL
jgi:NAD(P)-dependent dehydrogenase (short-subunit alcohol dehydrogenase family)